MRCALRESPLLFGVIIINRFYFSNRWSRFCMNSGRGVQRIRKLVNGVIGIFKDDPDEDEIEQPQVISQAKVQNRRDYVALEDLNFRNMEFGK